MNMARVCGVQNPDVLRVFRVFSKAPKSDLMSQLGVGDCHPGI